MFLEVGANIGTTTLQAARLAARCIAVEPEPRNVALWRANMAANGFNERSEIIAAAAGPSSGTVLLARSAVNDGDHRVSAEGDMEVPAVRVDDVLADRGITSSDIGLLWMDTQGFEAQALRGAPRLLKNAPLTVTEYWPPVLRERGDLEEMNQLIEGHWRAAIDLHCPPYRPEPIHALAARYSDGATDLLLLPWPEAAVDAAEVDIAEGSS